MGLFLNKKVKPGDWPRKVPASFFNKVDDVLSNLEVFNGHVEKYSDKFVIVQDQVEAPEFDHPFKVTDAGGLDIAISSGVVKGLYSGGEFNISETSTSVSNGTNYVGLRLAINYDTSYDFLIGSDTLTQYFHFLTGATIVVQSSAFTDTWSVQQKSSGYRYIDLATVTASSGIITNISQKWASDYNAIETAYTWFELT